MAGARRAGLVVTAGLLLAHLLWSPTAFADASRAVKARQTTVFAPVPDQTGNAALFVGVNECTVDPARNAVELPCSPRRLVEQQCRQLSIRHSQQQRIWGVVSGTL